MPKYLAAASTCSGVLPAAENSAVVLSSPNASRLARRRRSSMRARVSAHVARETTPLTTTAPCFRISAAASSPSSTSDAERDGSAIGFVWLFRETGLLESVGFLQ